MSHNQEEFSLVLESTSAGFFHLSHNLQAELLEAHGASISASDLRIGELPIEITSSPRKEDLVGLCLRLKEEGCKVVIVKRRTPLRRPLAVSETPLLDTSDFISFYQGYINGLQQVLTQLDAGDVQIFVRELLSARARGSRVFFIGNGGSSANASHFANDLTKRHFDGDQFILRALSLTDNISWMTATANDEGYDHIFTNQLRVHLQPNDVVVAISSSGNSPNVLNATQFAKERGATTFGIVGFGGGKLKKLASYSIDIPTKRGQYGFMEDVTLILGHITAVYFYERDQKQGAMRI